MNGSEHLPEHTGDDEQPVYATPESIDWEATAELWKERARDSEAKRAELEAVIQAMGDATDVRHGSKLDRLDRIAMLYAQSRSVVLGEHDREVAAQTLEAFADTLGVDASDDDTDELRGYRNGQRQALRKARERAAAIRNGEHA